MQVLIDKNDGANPALMVVSSCEYHKRAGKMPPASEQPDLMPPGAKSLREVVMTRLKFAFP
ncbi:MAG TPA: hypothetical protein PKA41_19600 [Verrucomicrobiota bacterium]|nr:hypothetical protein [Verrucomicrobiota bacterium]